MEEIHSIENNPEKIFAEAYERMTNSRVTDGFIELSEGVSKVDFLRWLVKEKGLLLHGSNDQKIVVLEPRQANCASKEFGNKKAVYAVEDCVLPTFYAIKDQQRFHGVAKSGVSETHENGHIKREYDFAVSREMLNGEPWSDGAVYVLPRETFVQGHDDDDNLIDEWASEVDVIPLGKVKITPEDFPYFNEIKATNN